MNIDQNIQENIASHQLVVENSRPSYKVLLLVLSGVLVLAISFLGYLVFRARAILVNTQQENRFAAGSTAEVATSSVVLQSAQIAPAPANISSYGSLESATARLKTIIKAYRDYDMDTIANDTDPSFRTKDHRIDCEVGTPKKYAELADQLEAATYGTITDNNVQLLVRSGSNTTYYYLQKGSDGAWFLGCPFFEDAATKIKRENAAMQ